MVDDPYKVLGVERSADDAAIRKAYRKLAKTYHPDLNPGDTAAADRFKEIAAAYEILGDTEKRRRYDAGEIDASGQERPPQQPFYRDFADAQSAHPYRTNAGFQDFEDVSDLFSDLFGAREGRAGPGGPRRGRDLRYQMSVSFRDAAAGTTTRVTMPDGRTLDITIPAGTRDGQTLRLKGQGAPGRGDGPPGDALVEIEVLPDPVFVRDGDDVRMELPIGIDDAILGGKVETPTLTGRVSLAIPAGASSGRTLRLKGKGLRRRDGSHGDQLVTLRIVLPETIDDDLREAMCAWRARHTDERKRSRP